MDAMTTSAVRPSPALLAAAPHRLMFFIGAGNLLLAMAWWAAWLAAQRWPGLLQVPQAATYPGWLHAFVMQYQVLPSFFFGFLLTVFPRWMGLPDVPRWRYALAWGFSAARRVLGRAGAEAGGRSVHDHRRLVRASRTGPAVLAERGATWHARSCLAAMLLGLAGVLCFGGFPLGIAVVGAVRGQARHLRAAVAGVPDRGPPHVSVLRRQCGAWLRRGGR